MANYYQEKWLDASISLQERIEKECRIPEPGMLDVTSVVNHVVDTNTLADAVDAFCGMYRSLNAEPVDFVFTVESSGIPFATLLADRFHGKVLYGRKKRPATLNDVPVHSAGARSYTKGNEYEVIVREGILTPETNVLIADDFIAKGEAVRAMLKIVEDSGAHLTGIVAEIVKDIPGQQGWKYLTQAVREINRQRTKNGEPLCSLDALVRIDYWPEDASNPSDLGYAKPELCM